MTAPITSFPINTTSVEAALLTASGSSAQRALGARAADIINVKDFGAKGDNATDDTAAVQAAIDYGFTNNKAVIWMPVGRYVTSAPLWLDHPNNMRRVDLGNPSSPAVGVTPPGFANPPIWQFSVALIGQWAGGPSINSGDEGVHIFPTYNNGACLYTGPGQGMAVVGITSYAHFTGPFRGGLPAGGLGFGVCCSSAGPTRTYFERCGAEGWRTSYMTAANNNGSLGDDNCFYRCWADNSYIVFNINSSQNFMNHFIDCEVGASTIGLYAPHGTGATVWGGNWSQNIGGLNDAFALSAVSAVTAVPTFGGNYQRYQFTATVAATGIGGISRSFINVNLNAYAIKTPHFGVIPVECSAFNPGTGVGTFITSVNWSAQMSGIGNNLLTSSHFGTEVSAITELYASERATTFLGNGITTMGNIHIENNCPTCLLAAQQDFGTARENIIREITWNTGAETGGGSPTAPDPSGSLAQFLVAQTWPTISLDLTATATTLADCSFLMNSNNGPIFDLGGSGNVFNARNNAYIGPAPINVLSVNTGGGGGAQEQANGAGVWDVTPFSTPYTLVNNGGPSYRERTGISKTETWGYRPAPSARPGVTTTDFNNLTAASLPAITAGPNVPYPVLCGGITYSVWDHNLGVQGQVREFSSNHLGYSYGQNLTTSNVSGLSWTYQGGSYVLYLDTGSLSLMFAGLCIILNNGVSGNVRYTVTGVYYSLGYVTVYNTATAQGTLAGVQGTQYSGTTIIQDPYAITILTGYPAPVTKTANYTVLDSDKFLIFNGAGSITVTLPNAALYPGRELSLRTIAAFTVISASSNVVPLAGGAAGTAILAATAGKYARLVSDGVAWQIIEAN